MRYKVGSLLVLAAALALPARGGAQPAAPATDPPPGPVPEEVLFPPAPTYGPTEALLAPDDPLLVPPGQGPGWFLDLDTGVVKPHVKAHFNSPPSASPGSVTSGPPNVGGRSPAAQVTLPDAPLDWSAMPVLGLGYRLAGGAGSLELLYSFVNSAGNATLPNFDAAGVGTLRSRLAVNRVDFAYFTSEYLLCPPPNALHSQWGGIGVSAADVFFDSQAVGQLLRQRASSNFAGVGPSLWWGWTKFFPGFPVSLYGQTQMSFFVGKVRQHFAEAGQAPGGPVNAAFATGPRSDGVGLFGAETGLRYAPGWYGGRLGFAAGYHWERWWYVGNTENSSAELTVQGLFLRGQFNF